MGKTATVPKAAISCLPLAAWLLALAAAVTLATASALRAITGTMAKLTTSEASSATFASTSEALTSTAESSTEPFASTFAAGTSCDVGGIVLSLAIVPSLIVPQSVALDRALAIGTLVPVHEDIFATIVLHNEAEAFLIIEELASAGLAHG